MPAPYTYDIAPPDMFGGFVSGLKLGAGIEELEAARLERAQRMFTQQKADEQQRMVQGLQLAFVENPNYENLQALAPFIPGPQAKVIQETINARGMEQARAEFNLFAPVAFALRSGNKDAALAQLDRLIAASENDLQRKKAFEDFRAMAEVNPDAVIAMTALTAYVAGAPDLAKSFLEKGKPESAGFTVMTQEETARVVPGATGVWGRDEKGKPVQIFKPELGFEIVPQNELATLGITAEPGKVVVQRNKGTGELKITNLGPLATATATQEVKLPAPEKALLKIDEDAVAAFANNAAIATTFARDAEAIERLLRGKGGGALVSLTTRIKEFANITDDTVTANTLARSLQTRGATQLRAPGSGSTTDFEMRAFLDSFPQLSQSERGRTLLAKYANKFADRQRKLADYARGLLKENSYSLEKMASFDNGLGTIFEDDITQLIGERPAPSRTAPAPSAPPAPAPVPAPAAAPPAAPASAPAGRRTPAAAPPPAGQRRNVRVDY